MNRLPAFRTILIVITLLAGNAVTFAEEPALWEVDTGSSRLGFTATYDDIPFQGNFHRYQSEIVFDPDRLDSSSFHIMIDLASVDTDNRDRDEALHMPEWLDVQNSPQATFDSTVIERQKTGEYVTIGRLTIKGHTREIKIPLSWNETSNTARLSGETRVDRREFQIGSGDWLQDETIGFDVNIEFDLHLTRL